MTAFLKIDNCEHCHRDIPWEFIPAVVLHGRPLAGTGIWRSQLVDGHCPACTVEFAARRQKEQQVLQRRGRLIGLLGGEKPYREFTFSRYEVTPGNRLANDRSKRFDPATENLYLWGPCGVGKTHLACATARRCFEETLSVCILPAYKLSRKARMKDPEQEQAAIDNWIQADVLILDDVGSGPDTAYSRQVLQEILDGRDFQDRAGLVVTSAYSLDALAHKMGTDAVTSRLAGMCMVIEISGEDCRLAKVRHKGKSDD